MRYIGERGDDSFGGQADMELFAPGVVQGPAVLIVAEKDRFRSAAMFQRITDGANAFDEKRPLLDSPFAAEERARSLDGRIVEAGDDRI
jgi:hypothetical protein